MTIMCMISERPHFFAPPASICFILYHGLTIACCTYTEIQIEHESRDFHLSLKKYIALHLAIIFSDHNLEPLR